MIEEYKIKKILSDKYWKENLTIIQIGKFYNVTKTTIRYWMIKLDIPRHTNSEATHLSEANHCNLPLNLIEWLNGELLGDGNLNSRTSYSACFQYSSKYKEYIQYVSDILDSFRIEQVGKINKIYHKRLDCYSYHYGSRRYVELLSIYQKWYPNNKKTIPKDIKLTSATCRQWYIGDGCLIHDKRSGRPFIILSTCAFPIKDVERLIEQLINLGFKTTRLPIKNIIRISAFSTKEFLNYIGKCPVKCYQYKFNY